MRNKLQVMEKNGVNLALRAKSFWAWLWADKKRLVVVILVILALFFGVQRLVAAQKSKVTYQTAQVTKGTVVSTISASGKALTTSSLTINTGASGVVSKVYVKDGDKVFAGQKIADITLDSVGKQQYQQALASFLSAKASVASANANYYTQQNAEFVANQKFINDAAARGLATDDPTYIEENATWKAAEANFLNQQTQLASSNASLSNSSVNLQLASPTITAPYSGVISDINLVEGMVIASSAGANSSSSTNATISTQRIAVITNNSNPIINVSLSEIDVPNVKIGQKATITFDSITDSTFTGSVATVDRIGTVSSNVTSYTVNIKLDSASEKILPNMAATANIIVDTATDVLTVPSVALTTQNGQTLAKTLVNGQEVDAPVTTGISSDTDTEIKSGLTEGQTVITGSTTPTTTTTSTGRSVFSGGFGGGGGGAVRFGRGG